MDSTYIPFFVYEDTSMATKIPLDNLVLRNFWCKMIADEILSANILLFDTTSI